MNEVITLADKLKRKREQLEAEGKLKLAKRDAAPPAPVPAAPTVTFMAPKPDTELDNVINGLDIITAYNMYAGKGLVEHSRKTEGIKVRCPNPAHPDNNPSAWINTDKQVWTCGACEQGGDKFDIAAFYFGMPVPGYKSGRLFPELRTRMAASMGYTVTKTRAGVEISIPEPPPPEPTKITGPDGVVIETGAPDKPEEVAEVIDLRPVFDEAAENIELDWRPLAPEGTFLKIYMDQATVDDVPEEYHLWNGLLAISMAIGREATLKDLRPVYGNLFVCILGRTGSGKSKAKYFVDSLLHQALPYSAKDAHSKGVLRTNAPASAEALIWAFQKRAIDPSDPAGSERLYPVRGLIDYSELSSLVGRTNRSGNVLVPTLMQFYDAEPTVSTVSRTHGTETAQEPYACAITTSQPKSLKGLLSTSDAASGFLNRWVFIMGKEKRRIAVGGVQPDVTPAVKPLQDVQGWASMVGTLEWDQAAIDLFTEYFHSDLYIRMQNDETDLLSRLDLLAKKLILLFTANLGHRKVQVQAVEQMQSMMPYILECYGVPGAQIGNSLQEELRNDIIKAIVSHTSRKGRGPSSRDINQIIKRKKYPLDLYNKTLKNMVDIDEIEAIVAVPEGGRGRPTTRYVVGTAEETKALAAELMGKRAERAKERAEA